MEDTLTRLRSGLTGRYEVERELGRGGMATVYLARDVRHERPVALKVLIPELGAVLGAERFLSEIRVTASLQHPNLLPLFDSGEAEGLLFYVMPFVEGESLRARLDREKQLPVEDAVHVAVSVASALEYAHRHGVIHRDLKPENILLQAGEPLVADFGIALAVSNAGGTRVTQTGLSLGTPQYMSPEQATGDRGIDARTDIYSLGAVTYEMLTGEPPHTGTTAQAIIARVLTDRPRRVRTMRAAAPTHVEAAIAHALEKLPADRFATAHEFAEALQGRGPTTSVASTGGIAAGALPPAPSLVKRLPGSLVFAGVSLLLAGTAGVGWWRAAHREATGVAVRFQMTFTPTDSVRELPNGNVLAISPDGTVLVYVGNSEESGHQLYSRRLNELVSHPIPGTQGADWPVFSPDGQWVAFRADGKLRKVGVTGGTTIPLASIDGEPNGLSWGTMRSIVLSVDGRLQIFSAAGGAPQIVPSSDSLPMQTSQNYPLALGDGEHALVTLWTGSLRSARLAVTSFSTGRVTPLGVNGSSPIGIVDRNLIFRGPDGSLDAIPFDPSTRRATGTPVPVIEDVLSNADVSMARVSASGSLVYQQGTLTSRLTAVDAAGHVRVLVPDTGVFASPRYSPDSRHVAVDNGSSILTLDLAAGHTLQRLTHEGTSNWRPEWTPNGRDVLFASNRSGTNALWEQAADGSSPAKLLLEIPGQQIWEGVLSGDGKTLVYRTGTLAGADIWFRGLSGDTTPQALAATAATEMEARLSPDGRWVAYTSVETNTPVVVVRPFPGLERRVQASQGAGQQPVWSRDGRFLFYFDGTNIVRASYKTQPTFVVESRTTFPSLGSVVSRTGHAAYDASPDGQEIVLATPVTSDIRTIVVHDWKYELRDRMRSANDR